MTDFVALATSYIQRLSQPRENRLVAVTATALAYLAAVHLLRYRRRNQIVRKYGRRRRRTLASMTVEEASEIRKQLANFEFPHAFTTSLFFALFKVCPFIPSKPPLPLHQANPHARLTPSRPSPNSSSQQANSPATKPPANEPPTPPPS